MTKIEWVKNQDGSQGRSWNPVTGCTKTSPGCANCYAERMARRLAGRCGYPAAPHHFDVVLRPDRLEIPLRRRVSTTYFCPSMGDLFHKNVPFEFIGEVFATILDADWHTFQILTKRIKRAQQFINWFFARTSLSLRSFRHIWLGVSVENQATADERIPQLLQIPAAVRFVSAEPLLSSIDLTYHLANNSLFKAQQHVGEHHYHYHGERQENGSVIAVCDDGTVFHDGVDLSQVIVGGESGPGARPMHPDWVRGLRDQCVAAGVAFFFKQWGAWAPVWDSKVTPSGFTMMRLGKKDAGRVLDGREWNEMPQ